MLGIDVFHAIRAAIPITRICSIPFYLVQHGMNPGGRCVILETLHNGVRVFPFPCESEVNRAQQLLMR